MKTEHLSAIKGEDGAWDLGDDHSKATPRTLLDVDDGVDPARCSVKVTYSDLGLALAYTLYLADTTDHTP